MLGFDVSERTVSRMMPRQPSDPEAQQRWRNFLRNHREVLAAMDFFTVPTATFHVLCVASLRVAGRSSESRPCRIAGG